MNELLEKYFRDERILYFHSSDALKNVEGDTFLRYKESGPKVEIWFGGDNGEMCLCVSNDPEKIESVIKAMLK